MTCYHPLKGFKIGQWEKSGKDKYKICSYDTTFVFKKIDGDTWYTSTDSYPGYVPGWIHVQDFIEVSCGKCIGCRLKYSRNWADRCVLESKYHHENYFITFTYDDDHLPMSYSKDVLGNEYNTPTLRMDDVQKLNKRIRKNIGEFRYFMCGEYGTHTMRPHYHYIAFGLHLDDLKFYKNSFSGYEYYNSEKLEKTWGKGFVVITPFSWETAAYTARYCIKKIHNNLKAFFETYNLEPEFVLMSRRPGIAKQYYLDHKDDIYEDDKLYMSTSKGVEIRRPPRYFDKMFEEDFPEVFENLKEQRKEMAIELTRLKLENTSLNYLEMLEVEEAAKTASVDKLKRKEI